MKKRPTTVVSIRLDCTLVENLKKIADAERMRLSPYIADLLEKYITSHKNLDTSEGKS